MAITNQEFAAANARGREMLRTTPHAVAARYDAGRDRIVVELSTGLEIAFAPRDAQGLETATPEDLAEIVIDSPGFGLHFPNLDADRPPIPAMFRHVGGASSVSVTSIRCHGLPSARGSGRRGGSADQLTAAARAT